MSSKLLPGDQSPLANPVEWRRLSTGSSPDAPADGLSSAQAARDRIHGLEREWEARESRAREEGRQAGIKQGQSEALDLASRQLAAECEQILARVSQSVEQLLAFRLRVRQQLEEDLVRLAVAVARRILHRELHVDPEALLGIVKAAAEKMDVREILRFRIGVADAPVLARHFAGLNLPPRVEFVTDPALPRGSVIVETSRGQMDASIETQLAEIDRGLADLVDRS
jgi:flagellar assembly protein FliH